MALLEVEGLRSGYERLPVIFGIHLEVGEGEVVALLGLNGAGKTTTLRAISGMIPVMGGRIRFDGNDIAGLPAEQIARRGLLHIPEGRGIFPSLRVDESLRLAAAMARVPAAEARSRFEERRAQEHAWAILHFLGLKDRAGSLAADLPVGLQRRLELGRALMSRPRLLLLDEPAAGLDNKETADLAGLLLRIRERFAVTMLLVDHDMALVMRVCDNIYVLDFGELLTNGTPASIRQDPEVIRAYLGEGVA